MESKKCNHFLRITFIYIDNFFNLVKINLGIVEINSSCTANFKNNFINALLQNVISVEFLEIFINVTYKCPNILKAYSYESNNYAYHNFHLAFL